MNKKVIIIFICVLVSCQPKKEYSLSGNDSTRLQQDYFTDKVVVKHARNFTVTYHNHYKVVRTSATLGDWGTPGGEVEDVKDVMILVQQGTPPPELTGDLARAALITIPASAKIGSNSSGLEIWLDMLGLKNNQVFIGGTKTYNDSIRTFAEKGIIGQVGYSWAAPPVMEVLIDRNPDLFLMVISRVGFNKSLDKARSLGIQRAPVFDWAERDYLATAEWIKYCALYKEKEANERFAEIESNVTKLKALVFLNLITEG